MTKGVIQPASLTQVARAAHYGELMARAVSRLAEDPTVPGVTPENVERITQALGQALAQDENFFAVVKRRFGAVDFAMLSGAGTGLYAIYEMAMAEVTWSGIVAGVYTAGIACVPLAKTLMPRFGMWLERFVQR